MRSAFLEPLAFFSTSALEFSAKDILEPLVYAGIQRYGFPVKSSPVKPWDTGVRIGYSGAEVWYSGAILWHSGANVGYSGAVA